MIMIVTGIIETWYDPTKPYYTHHDSMDLGRRRKPSKDSTIKVECRSERIANDLAAVFRALEFKNVRVEDEQ